MSWSSSRAPTPPATRCCARLAGGWARAVPSTRSSSRRGAYGPGWASSSTSPAAMVELLALWALAVAFVFQDPAIVESSGLAVVDGRVVTTNDSGDTGRVFTVDPRSGET